MNKNVRGSFDERSGIRPANRNNINIQINFNMKDKNQGFAGKKIDNLIEVDPKSALKIDPHSKRPEENKKQKKKQTIDRQQKDKAFDTPLKYKQLQGNKNYKNIGEKTPEGKSHQKKQERSKSTNQKLGKKKNAKSMQNIRAGIKYTKNREFSPPHSSEQKSRSRSKSSKKLLKSNDQSLKNLFVFSNSGIKNKIIKEKQTPSRERQISTISKKTNKQQDHHKIKKYMEQKNKKIKIQKHKQIKQQKLKKQKLKQQLKKVQAERRANASKPISISKLPFAQKEQRLPIYCFDEDDFDEENEYDSLKKQASKIIHDSPPPANLMEGVTIRKPKDSQKARHSSSNKKSNKHKKTCLVHRYLNGSITENQFEQLEKKIIKIQSFWRGYACRKTFLKKISDQATRFRYIKNKIQNKRGAFWNEQEDNSIINIQKDSTVKVYESGSSSINCINYNNGQSDISDIDYHLIADQKEKTDKFKRLCIQFDDDAQEQMQDSKERSQKQTYQNSKMLRQIEELRKMLQNQSQKYRSLQEQNQNLKANIKNLSLKDSRQIKNQKSQDLINSKDFIQIRMPKKIESPHNLIKVEENVQSDNSFRNKRQIKGFQKTTGEKSVDLNSFKKQFQIFQCSSPSNARLQQQLKHLKQKNIENVFLKKQIKIQEKYAKKSEMFDKMLNDKVFSPRIYNAKKKQLESKLKIQKQQVKQRLIQAKRVVGFIQDISSEQQQKQKQAKNIKEQNEQLSLRKTHKGVNQIKPDFKKQKEVKDIYTNTSPLQNKQIAFKSNPQAKQKPLRHSDSDYSSDEDKVYKKYWTDDIEEVHKHTLQITRKIQEALKAQSEESSARIKRQQNKQQSSESYNSQQFRSCDSHKQQTQQHIQIKKSYQGRSKSSDLEVNLETLKDSYEDYLEEIKELPTEPEKKARQIFNKIDLSQQQQCKSEDQMQDSNDNICQLLNQRPLHNSPHNDEVVQEKNLYVSQAEFNKKKRKQQQLSRSSSFQKSNKSLSANNSQLQCKGFITNLTFIKQFCISVCQFIRNSQHYRQLFVQNISQRIKYDQYELMRSYRVTVSGEVKNNYNTFQDQYVYPYFNIIAAKSPSINHELFNDFMKIYDEEKSNNLTWNDPSMNKITKQMRGYFLVSIIDTFNESLQYQKPGSVHGQPLPWLSSSKNLKNHQNVVLKKLNDLKIRYSSDSSDYQQQNEQQKRLDQIFGASIAKIIQWGSCLCGFIADPMPMQMGDSQIANLSDEQLNSIRQNRVGLMLEKWLLQQEQTMTNSTSEYTQVLLYLGEKIIQLLITECSEEVFDL